jgi:hypothetical protein
MLGISDILAMGSGCPAKIILVLFAPNKEVSFGQTLKQSVSVFETSIGLSQSKFKLISG